MERIPVVQQNVQKSDDIQNQNSNNNTKSTTQQTSSSSLSSPASSLPKVSSPVSLPERKIITLHSTSLPSVKILSNSGANVAVSKIGSSSSSSGGLLNDDNKRGIFVVGGTQQQHKQNIVRVLPTNTTIPMKNSTGQNGNLFIHGNKVVQLQYKTASSSTQGTPLSLITTSGNKKIPITLVTSNTIVSKGTGTTITSPPSLIPISTSSNFVSIGSTLQTVTKMSQKPIITSVQSDSKIIPNVVLPTKAIERRVLPAATVIAVTPNYQQMHQQQFSTTQPITIINRNSIKPGQVLLATNPEITSVTVDRKLSQFLTPATSTITTPTVLYKNSSSSNLTDKSHVPKSYLLPSSTPLQSIQSSLPASTTEQKLNTVKTSSSASLSPTTSVTSDSEETKTLSLKNFEVFEKLHQAEAALNVKYDYNFDDNNYNTDTDENLEIFSSSSQLPSQQQQKQKENDNNNVKDDKLQSLFIKKSIENIKTSPRTEKRSKSLTTIRRKNNKKYIKKRQLSLDFHDPLKIKSNDLNNCNEKNEKNENSKQLFNETNNDNTDNLPTPMSLLCNETIAISPSSSTSSKIETSSNESIGDYDDVQSRENDNKIFESVAVRKIEKNSIDLKQEQNQQQQKEIKKEEQEIKEEKNQNKTDNDDNKTKQSNIVDDDKIFKVPQMIKKKIIEKYNKKNIIKFTNKLNDTVLTGIAKSDLNKNVMEYLKSDSAYSFLDWTNNGLTSTKDKRVYFKLNRYGLIEITDDHYKFHRKIYHENRRQNNDDDLKYLPSTSSGFRSEKSYTITKKNDENISSLSTSSSTSSSTSDQKNKNDDDIFVKPTLTVMKSRASKMKSSTIKKPIQKPVKKQQKQCLICPYRGLSTDFLTPGYCSFGCIQKMQKQQSRSTSSLYSRNKNDNNNKNPIKEENTNDNKTDDKNNKKTNKEENTNDNKNDNNATDDNKTDDNKTDDINNDEKKPTTRRTLKRKCNEIQEQKKKSTALSYYKRKKLEKQMKQLQEDKKSNFDWNIYLKKHNAKAAPKELFIKSLQNVKNIGRKCIKNPFKTGMKIEAIDPEHQSLYCVCTIVKVNGHRLKLHFDGYSNIYDFWVNSNSKYIFPPGWCEETKRHLEPPFGITPSKFNWEVYLINTNSNAAPASFFKHLYEPTEKNPFEIGMKLEADDLKNTRTVCVASVSDILGDRILVHFDGWHDLYDYWIEIDSPYIHYINWHKERGLSIYPPPHWEMGSFTWEEYYKEEKFKSTKRSVFPKPRPTLPFKIGQKLEVVDKKNPSLIRPATIIDTAPYELRIVYDGWLQRYAFWIMDDSPNLYPAGWCEANGHDLEPPPGYANLPTKMPCPILNCRGIGSAKRTDIEYHSNEDSCPYHPVNWRDKTELPDRLESNETKTKREKKVSKRKNEDLKNTNQKPIKIIKGTRTNKKNISATTVTSTTTKPIRSSKSKATKSTTENNQENRILRKSLRRNNKMNDEIPNFLIPQKKIKIEPIANNDDANMNDKMNANKNKSTKTPESTVAAKYIEEIDTKESIINQSIKIKIDNNEEEDDKKNIEKDLKIDKTLTSPSSTVNEKIENSTDSKTEIKIISTDAKTSTITKIKTEKPIVNEIASASTDVKEKTSKTSTITKIKTEKPIANEIASVSTNVKEKTSKTSTITKIKTEKPIANEIASVSTNVKEKTSKTSTIPKIKTEKPIANETASASTGVKEKTSKRSIVPKIKTEKPIANEIASASTGVKEKISKTSAVPKIKTEKPIANEIASASTGVKERKSKRSIVLKIKTEKPIANEIASASAGVKEKTSKTSTIPKIKTEKPITNEIASASTGVKEKISKTSAVPKIKTEKPIANEIASASTGVEEKTPKTSTISKIKTEKPVANDKASASTGFKEKTSKISTIPKITTEIPIINTRASASTGATANTSKISTIPKITTEIPIINTRASASTGATANTSKISTIPKITTEISKINTRASASTDATANTSKISTIPKITTEIPIINTRASASTGGTSSNNNTNKRQNELDFKNISMNVASHLLCDYGPRLDLAYSIWFENSLHMLRNPKESIFDSVNKNPLEWNATEVSTFMSKIIQIEQKFVEKFAECKIDGASFLAMRQTDLTNILEVNLGPSIKIYNFILQLRVVALTKFKKENEQFIHGPKFVFQHHKIEDLKAIKDAKSAKAAAKAAKESKKAEKEAEKVEKKEKPAAKATVTRATQTEIQPEVEETITITKKTAETKE